MSEHDGRPGRDSDDTDGDFADDPIDLRALFGSDLDALDDDGSDAADVSAADAVFVRSVLSADLDAVPAGPTTAQIIAAARAAHPDPARQESERQVRNADFERGELAARRRRRWNTGLLAAAGLAAVLVIAVPIALNSGGTDATSAASMAAPAAPTSVPAGAAASGADSAETAGSAMAESAPAGSAAAGSAGSGDTASEDAASDDTASTRAQTRAPEASASAASSAESSAAASSAAGPAPAPSIEPMTSSRAMASEGSSTATDAGICTWTELPAGAADLANSTFGGVVGVPRPLAADCAAGRVSGATFAAADGSRGGITVQVQSSPSSTGSASGGAGSTNPPCAPDGCRPDGGALYSAADTATRTVWLYADGQQIRVTASAGLAIDDAALATFARGIADLVP